MMRELYTDNDLHVKAEVVEDKYGATLHTQIYEANTVGIPMNPRLAKLTIEVLQKYIRNNKRG